MANPVSNPYTIWVAANQECIISATSHAAYYQILTITVSTPVPQTFIFRGSGEGMQMLLNNTSAVDATIDPFPRPVSVTFSFGFQTSPRAPVQMAPKVSVSAPHTAGGLTVTTMTSEDATDGDDNDTYVLVICSPITAPTPATT